MRRDPGFTIRAEVHDKEAVAALRASKRDINRGVTKGLRAAVREVGLPVAKSLAPGKRIRAAMTAGATQRSAYLQVSLRKAPEAGLLEFGGTVRAAILPKAAQALAGGDFGPVAAVTTPRRYRGKHYLEKAVVESLPGVTRVAQEAMARMFEEHGLNVS